MKYILRRWILPIVFIGLLYLYFSNSVAIELRSALFVSIEREGKNPLILPLILLVDSLAFYLCYKFIYVRPYKSFNLNNIEDIKQLHIYEILRLIITLGLSVYLGFKIKSIVDPFTSFTLSKYYPISLWSLVIIMPFFSIINIFCENSEDMYNRTIIILDLVLTVIVGTFMMLYLLNRHNDTKGWFWWCSLFAIVYLGARMYLILLSIDGEGLFIHDNSAASYIKQIIYTVLLSAFGFVLLGSGDFKTFFTVSFRIAEVLLVVGSFITALTGGSDFDHTTFWLVIVEK